MREVLKDLKILNYSGFLFVLAVHGNTIKRRNKFAFLFW